MAILLLLVIACIIAYFVNKANLSFVKTCVIGFLVLVPLLIFTVPYVTSISYNSQRDELIAELETLEAGKPVPVSKEGTIQSVLEFNQKWTVDWIGSYADVEEIDIDAYVTRTEGSGYIAVSQK